MKKCLNQIDRSRVGTFVVMASVLALLLASSSALRAQRLPADYETEPYPLDSGMQHNSSDEEIVAFATIVRASTNTPIMRVHFNGYNLGRRSYVTLTSLRDGGVQRLDAKTMPQWQDTSALFNGDAVKLELRLAAGEKGCKNRPH